MRFIATMFVAVLVLAWCGCGGSNGNNYNPPAPTLSSISVSPSSATMWVELNAQQFTATGRYSDGTTRDLTSTVTWSSSSMSTATITAAGLAIPVSGGSVSISATSGGVTGTSSVTVVGLAGAYINPSGPVLSLSGSPSSAQLSATAVWTDGKTQDLSNGMTWSSSDPGVVTVNGTGYLTRGGNAGSATVSANFQSMSISTAVSVTAQNYSDANLAGTYVFLMNGVDPSGPAYSLGGLTADGSGNITGQVTSESQAGIISTPAVFTGTYSVFSDGRGDMILSFPSPLTTTRMRFALTGTGSNGRMMLFDPTQNTAMTGVFQKQSDAPFSVASLQGTYVFKLGGANAQNKPQAVVGMITADGTGAITAGTADWNDNGTVNIGAGRDVPLAVTGSYILDTDGHGAMTLNVGATQLHFSMFVTSNGLFRLLCTDPGQRMLGQFELQQLPEGGFANMDGNYTFLLENGGRGGILGMAGNIQLGPLSWVGGWGSLTNAGAYSDLEVNDANRFMSAGGRGTLDLRFFVRPYATYANYSFAVYMVSTTRMYWIETDSQSAYAGLAQGQADGQLNGTYLYMGGSLGVASGTESSVLGLLNATQTDVHNGTFNGIIDVNLPMGNGLPATRVVGSVLGNGTFTADPNSIYQKWTGLISGSENMTFYINSGNQAVMFGQTGVTDNPDIEGWLSKQ